MQKTLCLASTRDPLMVRALEPDGGTIRRKILAAPHPLYGGQRAKVEYLSFDPVSAGERSVLERTSVSTEVMYAVLEGEGLLVTEGVATLLSVGEVALLPAGISHTLRQHSPRSPFSLLVIELAASKRTELAPWCVDLPARMRAGEALAPVRVGGVVVRPLVAEVSLQERGNGLWGSLSLMDLPPGAQVEEYCEPQAEQVLFLRPPLSATIITRRPDGLEDPGEIICVEASEEAAQCLVVPPGVARRIENRGTGSARLLCVNIRLKTEERGGD